MPGRISIERGRCGICGISTGGNPGMFSVVEGGVAAPVLRSFGDVAPELAGTPACPPIGSGHGKVSTSDPLRAPSMVLFQISAGSPEP